MSYNKVLVVFVCDGSADTDVETMLDAPSFYYEDEISLMFDGKEFSLIEETDEAYVFNVTYPQMDVREKRIYTVNKSSLLLQKAEIMLDDEPYNSFTYEYGVVLDEELEEDTFTKSTVLLHDYTKQLPQSIIPRQQINDSILDVEAECIPFMRTNLIAASGVKGMRVNDADQQDDVFTANKQIISGALTGNVNVPIVGTVEFQELASQVGAKPAEYMLAMQSLDNFRLSTYGLENGGLFEKKYLCNVIPKPI